MTAVRLQVDDEYGTATVFLDHELTDDERAVLEPLLDVIPADVPRDLLLTSLIRRVADEEAYERVCRERGLLL